MAKLELKGLRSVNKSLFSTIRGKHVLLCLESG